MVPAVEVEARSENEPRFLRIGKIASKLYSCFFTIRKDAMRLISVRRSREEEEKTYYEEINKDEETTEENKS